MDNDVDRMMDMDIDYENINGVFKGMTTAASGTGNAEVKKAYTKLQIVNVFNWIIILVKSIREIRVFISVIKPAIPAKKLSTCTEIRCL